jgi:hypothetical protein
VDPADRPFDPDDLPIVACQSDEERRLTEIMPARIHGGQGEPNGHRRASAAKGGSGLRPRELSLRRIAGRLLRGR